ncbi:MAG: translation initiation factor IF-2 [Hungatella sp.]|nr:translation initiation factor IF-2 [Hungatella sp.]
MRVNELAKELGKTSKEVLDILQKHNIEIKSHSSNVTEEHIQVVKKAVGGGQPQSQASPAPAAAKPSQALEAAPRAAASGGASAEPPKKKITAVYRPQNSQTMRNAGPRSAQGGGRPQNQGGREGGRPQNQPLSTNRLQPGTGQGQLNRLQPAPGQSQTSQAARPQPGTGQGQTSQAARPQPGAGAVQSQPARSQTAGQSQVSQSQGAAAQSQISQPVQSQSSPGQAASRPNTQSQPAAGERTQTPQSQAGTAGRDGGRSQGQGSQAGRFQQGAQGGVSNRDNSRGQGQGSRDGRNQRYQGNRDGGRSQGQGYQGSRDGSRQGGYQGRDGNRPQGQGYQGSRDGSRQGGFQGRDGNRPQGQGYQGSRDGSRQGGFQGRDGNRPQGQGYQGSRDGSRQGGYQGRDGNRPQGQGYQGSRDGSRQGGYQGRDGSRPQGQGYQGSRDGSRQGGYQGRDGNRPQGQGGRVQGGRPGQKDISKSFDTPIATKPQSNRGNKNAYKNDKYDKKNMTEDGPRTKGKVSKHPFIMPQKNAVEKVEETIKVITIPEVLTIKELAEKMKLQPSAIIKKLFMKGTIVTVNQEIDYEKAEEIAMEYDVLCEKEEKVDVIEELLKEAEESEDDMEARPPVVCVMGHVDHGKTSLLDAIRETNVTAREAGGITQHIGAYVVEINGEKITFLDTPGHEAFTAMRMRGAQSTDIAVLVVAADDGVMPQTVEAINHAKAAEVEIIVAINKIDKPSANVERVKQELSEYELIPEDWGGSTIFVPVSAHTREGISELLEMIILASEVKELKANPNRKARGLVIEAELDKGKGPVATVLVQKGTLRIGDNIAAGACYGKVRAMMDDKGRRVKEATPSTPVEILGLNGVPNAGEVFVVSASEKEARSFAETFISEGKNKLLEDTKAKLSLDDLFSQIKAGNVKELPIIVKADVQGSVEAVKQSLLKLSNEEVMVKVIHGGVGAINESDVSLASASNAIIIGFNVRPDVTAKSVAEQEKVDLRLYKVIYQAIEDVEAAMKGMLDPIFEEKVIGHAVVRQTFKASGVGTIAGSYVLDGKFQRGCSVRITRDGEQIFDGALASLRRFKDDVKEVATGYECGLVFEKFNDLQEDDMIEAYAMVEVPR